LSRDLRWIDDFDLRIVLTQPLLRSVNGLARKQTVGSLLRGALDQVHAPVMLVVLFQLFPTQDWVIWHQSDHLPRTLLHRARLPLRRDIEVSGAAIIL